MPPPGGYFTGNTPADCTTTYSYDAAGNPTTLTDPYGRKRLLGSNRLNQLTVTQDTSGRRTTYAYDALGRIKIRRGRQRANPACTAMTFAEQVLGLTTPHSRHTPLLREVLTQIVLEGFRNWDTYWCPRRGGIPQFDHLTVPDPEQGVRLSWVRCSPSLTAVFRQCANGSPQMYRQRCTVGRHDEVAAAERRVENGAGRGPGPR
ncbi:hypothetical protein [Streptomyces sp. NPDC014006]|uniref:hypothetical protein n=1 Tax=Streptomyces sp. NPDC014006 TaxID=3364870 RepID=UPI00370195D6